MANARRHDRNSTPTADQRSLYSTTEGRQRFPDLLQTSYGSKAVIGFDRYGRALGAVVPMEAVRVLAGFSDSVDEDIKRRIEQTAKSLLQKLPAEAALCKLNAKAAQEPELMEVAEVDAQRKLKGRSRRRRAN